MGDVVLMGGEALPPPRIRPLGVFWYPMRLSTMPPDESLRFEGGEYLTDVGAVVCRGRLRFTMVLPRMREPINPSYLAMAVNDNKETEI